MPHWGRPPGGSSGVGRYFEGVDDDVHRFQELSSDDEKGGVVIDQDFTPALNGKNMNPDELYFNDMDIRAWESRTSALAEPMHGPVHGYGDYHEEYFGGPGETINSAEMEEMLFRRVLDKIRVARAVGNTDVSLSAEELDAYQSRLYGARASAVRPDPQPRPTSASYPNDTASVVSYGTTGKPGTSSSRSKKSQPRTSMFGSKSKKEKRSSGHKRTSTASTTEGHASPPGFIVPGPDGQPTYAPINAYEGSLVHNQGHLHSVPRSNSEAGHHVAASMRPPSIINMLGSFPESECGYQPPLQDHVTSSRQAAREADIPLGSRTRSSSIQSSRLVPFPVEPYQYHNFSPTSSSSSPTSPQPPYTRNISSAVSEASYASVPRRIPQAPTPTAAATSVSLPRVVDGGVGQDRNADAAPATQGYSSATPVQAHAVVKDGGGGHGGERRRKSGKSRKKG